MTAEVHQYASVLSEDENVCWSELENQVYWGKKGPFPPETRELYNCIFQYAEKIYPGWQAEVVCLAGTIAVTAHQANEVVGKRLRKSDGSPYINHCLETALRLMDDRLDFLTVSAMLLHDVPEDVRLGPYNSKEAWFYFIRDTFNRTFPQKVGFLQNRKIGDLLSELVAGVTEIDKEEVGSDEFERIKKTALYSVIEDYDLRGGTHIRKGRLPINRDEEKEQRIALLVKRMETIFDRALVSPDHWRILIVKIADFWHNSKTPEYMKAEKRLRGRVFAALAQMMGYDNLASEIIFNIAFAIDPVAAYRPQTEDKDLQFPDLQDLSSINERLNSAYNLLNNLCQSFYKETLPEYLLKRHSYGLYIPRNWAAETVVFHEPHYPWFDKRFDLHAGVTRRLTLPYPQITILVTDFDKLRETIFHPGCRYSKLRIGGVSLSDKKIPVFLERKNPYNFYRILNQLGQRQNSLVLLSTYGIRQCALFFRENKPSIVDLFRVQEGSLLPSDVPESGLFNDNLRYSGDSVWLNHLDSLLAFLYEENLPFSQGLGRSRQIIILYEGNFYFLCVNPPDNWKSVAQTLGLDNDQSSYELLGIGGRPIEKFDTHSDLKLFSDHFVEIKRR